MKMKKIAAGISAIVLAASTTLAVSATPDKFDYDTATANEAPVLLTAAVPEDDAADVAALEDAAAEDDAAVKEAPVLLTAPAVPDENKADITVPEEADKAPEAKDENADTAEIEAPELPAAPETPEAPKDKKADIAADEKEAVVTEAVAEEAPEIITEAEVTTAATEEIADVTDVTEKKGPGRKKDVTVSITDNEVSNDILAAIEEALENSPKANEESWTNPLSDIDDEQMTFDFIIKHADVRPDGTIHVDGVIYNEDLTKLISYSPDKEDKEFKVPPTVKVIEESAFEGNKHLEKVHIGEGTKKIGPKAFKDCPKLHEVEMNKDVKVIGPKAFEGTEDLTVIEIPDNVKAFIEDAFDNSESIEDLVMYALDKYASVKFGDLNGDDVTDLTDLSILAVKLMDKDNFSKIETIVADVMEDSKVDIADLARLKQYVMGEKIVLGPQV